MQLLYKTRWTAILLVFFLLMGLFSGCETNENDSKSNSYDTAPSENERLSSRTVSTDGDLSLEWDAERAALLLKQGGELLWSSMPYEQYIYQDMDGAAKRYLESHLILKYIEPNTQQLVSVNSYYGVNENGYLSARQIDNGIRLTYCFDAERIAVPVEYRLFDGALEVSVIAEDICEDDKLIYSLSVLPYAASVPNDDANSLFVPDGSGMLMYCGDDTAVRTFSAPVYGGDLAVTDKYNYTSTQAVRLPCYGCSVENLSLFCIITEGAAASTITATAGDRDLTYSYAYTTFQLRGMDVVSMSASASSSAKKLLNKFTADKAAYERMTVRMYPLYSQGLDTYNTMAACYRSYLIEEQGLLSEENVSPLLELEIPMAAQVKENVLGVTTSVSKAVHTYDQVEKIISAFGEEASQTIVRLTGIQNNGLGISKIAGGFTLDSALGNTSSLTAMQNAAKEKGVALYPDFDIVRFRKSMNGFSKKSAAVKLPTTDTAYKYFFSVDTQAVASTNPKYMLLSPTYYDEAVSGLATLLQKKSFTNVSLSGFGSLMYSDYGYKEQYVGMGYEQSVTEALKDLQDNKIRVMTDDANLPAAIHSDVIVSAPLNTSEYYYEGQWVPFYQMVFKGYTSMMSDSVNLARNGRRELLRAVQTGTGLSYSIGSTDTVQYVATSYYQLSAGSFDDNYDEIKESLAEVSKVLKKVQGTTISSFIVIDDDVYQTVFSNGVIITVNYGEAEYCMADGTLIDALGFVCVEG